jgi:hypothetical protein
LCKAAMPPHLPVAGGHASCRAFTSTHMLQCERSLCQAIREIMTGHLR